LLSVQGWVGPEGADQDFVYADSWFEVKSTGASASSIIISSLEQLDSPDAGKLIIVRIDKTAPEKPGAVSLNETVRHVRDKLAADAEALDLYQVKLAAYGYMDLQEYSEQKYFCSGVQRYRVDELFPKLTRKSIPAQILSLLYELNLPSLESWREE
jgi:hypothetical protein